jgi:hypothetical protein
MAAARIAPTVTAPQAAAFRLAPQHLAGSTQHLAGSSKHLAGSSQHLGRSDHHPARSTRLAVELFARTTPAMRQAIEREADAMSVFLGQPCAARFASG